MLPSVRPPRGAGASGRGGGGGGVVERGAAVGGSRKAGLGRDRRGALRSAWAESVSNAAEGGGERTRCRWRRRCGRRRRGRRRRGGGRARGGGW